MNWSEAEIEKLLKTIEEYYEDSKFRDFLKGKWKSYIENLDCDDVEKLKDNFIKALREILSIESSPQIVPDSPEKLQVDKEGKLADQLKQSKKTPSAITAVWKYLPVPEEPDKHQEFDCKQENMPGKLKLIGARVRGKGHKHEGTNCDDWFELAVSGSWTIIAVSDGAGSKKFSRVGAKVSCKAASQQLAQELNNHKLQERDKWGVDTFQRDETTGAFAQPDLEFVQQSLHRAVKTAYEAVEKAAQERDNSVNHYEVLGNRRLNINDLSATLLLAVHTIIRYKENDYSFVLTCQIGDGMIAAIDHNNELQLLCQPDKGEFAGQTEFLTSKKKLERDTLMSKTFPLFRPLKALMVMTDGVAEDYFPYAPGILELYGDLILNQIIDIPKPNDEDIANQLLQTNLGSIAGVEEVKDKFVSTQERITAAQSTDEPKIVCIRSVADYAKELDISLSDLISAPILLWAGFNGETMWEEGKNKSPQEKLRVWLDSYYRRGSFDDRTLAILYREVIE